ncbi:hypothetical protein BRADI_2g13422v3 [Brachypodium distachyon]|uniref:Uncharacterized protein n=1 Tax=Brachypodium distachyon TaxID=15368 RepID=I1HFH7_BRADI|nr:hypothetical protein BRADI_2g13422v3 [Brachypodium distachyon]
MATPSSPYFPSPSTSAVSVLPPLCPSRFRSKPRPPPATAVSLLPVGRSWPGLRCRGAAGPLPPSSEPPPPSPQDWQERLSRLQDTVRIFFAVLFWMSLFFWGSAWGGSNNSGGKKRQRFRNKSK